MLMILFALAVGSYPPSQEDAARAVAEQIPGDGGVASLNPARPGFDLALRLDRCIPQASYEVRNAFGGFDLVAGHECVMTISRRARPDYQVRGFFHHDGYDWRYYGPTGEPLVAETLTHGINGAFSSAKPKPGSILYRGDAAGEIADPYARILSGYDWFRAPSD
ncbi:MAG TPA: hypothetical protein DDZ68_15720 [Parvularcula sp.]|nr:hypothetical protein [Parvularcula sp.]HBS32490.1 hypothetical protein [Parvularcula sp.]HBS34035.1 hypothetical protein [Parvularcula sp.]